MPAGTRTAPCRRLRPAIVCRSKLRRKHQHHANPDASTPAYDYLHELTTWRSSGGCPPLLLAPMENLADRPFRVTFNDMVGGFSEACTEFIRVPGNPHHTPSAVAGVVRVYNCRELSPVPLGAQIMGGSPEVLAEAARQLAHELGAPRVDLNCGCPANTVTGNGAGSSLLRTPERLEACVRAMVEAVGGRVPVSVKMRSGFLDTSRFEENLLAAQEGGAAFVTIHPRTKAQSYRGRADWALTARAKELLRVPVVGNGDVVSAAAAQDIVRETGCDAVMVGRGAVQDPLLFWRIRAAFQRPDLPLEGLPPAPAAVAGGLGALGRGRWDAEVVQEFLRVYEAVCYPDVENQDSKMVRLGKFGRLKRVVRYLFAGHDALQEASARILRAQVADVAPTELVEDICREVKLHWRPLTNPGLVNHMSPSKKLPGGPPAVAAPHEDGEPQLLPAATPVASGTLAGDAARQSRLVLLQR